MFIYRIEIDEIDENGKDRVRRYCHGFKSHSEADWWASLNPHYITMSFLMEVERNEKDHLIEV